MRLTGTHEPASGNSGAVADSIIGTSIGANASTVDVRTGDNQAEYDTPL